MSSSNGNYGIFKIYKNSQLKSQSCGSNLRNANICYRVRRGSLNAVADIVKHFVERTRVSFLLATFWHAQRHLSVKTVAHIFYPYFAQLLHLTYLTATHMPAYLLTPEYMCTKTDWSWQSLGLWSYCSLSFHNLNLGDLFTLGYILTPLYQRCHNYR